MNWKTPLTLGLLALVVLSACAPSTTTVPDSPPPPPTSAPAEPEPAPGEPPATLEVTESEMPEVAPTSRGDDLHATDPATVNIAKGEPQLIEFFTFW